MHILGLVLACSAYAICGRRVHSTSQNTQGSFSVDGSLRRLLLAPTPAAGWQAFGAGQSHSFAPSVQPSEATHSLLSALRQPTITAPRCPQPCLRKVPEKPYYPAKWGINAIGYRKTWKGGNVDEAMAESVAIQKYGQRRYTYFRADDPDLATKDSTWFQRQEAKRKLEVQQEQAKANYEAQKQQVIQDHAFFSVLGSAAMWYFFNLKVCVSYALGATFGGLFVFLLAQSIDAFAPRSPEEVKSSPPAIIAPLSMFAIAFKKQEVYFIIPVMVGFISHLFSVTYQIAYPEGWGAEKVEEKERQEDEQLPTIVTES